MNSSVPLSPIDDGGGDQAGHDQADQRPELGGLAGK
jgi:hypothetical protein